MRNRDGKPLWVTDEPSGTTTLERVELAASSAKAGYDEAWLQDLLYHHPQVLPVEQIDPGFGRLVPICRELPLVFGAGRTGYLDNVFVTKEGQLLLVETKLWRNAEARRVVVAQAMEYAAAVFRMNYERFESAILKGKSSDKLDSLYAKIKAHEPETDEPSFTDSVARNLRRGRAIVAIVGDGIREDIEPLAELLQSHAGFRFTFALIELAVYRTPAAGVHLLSPSILARTALIERGVVQIEDPRIVINDVASAGTQSVTKPQSFGITADEFYERLDERRPGASALLKAFLVKAETLGVRPEFKRSLSLKHTFDDEPDMNLAGIDRNGLLDTSYATWWGRDETGHEYNQTLADLIGGFVRQIDGQEMGVRTKDGKLPTIFGLLPTHEEAWLTAMGNYIRNCVRKSSLGMSNISGGAPK